MHFSGPPEFKIFFLPQKYTVHGSFFKKAAHSITLLHNLLQFVPSLKPISLMRQFLGHLFPSSIPWPMINLGKHHVKILRDGWTAVTRDRSLSAQFEHSVGVTEDGCEIFTTSPAGYTKPPYLTE